MAEMKPSPSLRVDILRHGKTNYGQQEVPMEQANDLTSEGIEKVKISAKELADLVGREEEVEIWSSPMGRTLHTAKIVAEVLEQNGVKLRRKGDARDSGIKVFPQLGEVKNFSWSLFSPLVFGGDVEFNGHKFTIDKEKTNPKGLHYLEYFADDVIKSLPSEVTNQWPEGYVKAIEGFEKFASVTKRIMVPLSRLKKLEDKSYRVIIVTHDGLAGFIANIFANSKQGSLNPGEFINLERRDGKLVATRVGDVQEGNSNTDVVDEFNRTHGN
jgi:broad specificity phosphatase PhoE